jgi:2,3-bisphosphoglycerate-dependent phosphoglycerate mutase
MNRVVLVRHCASSGPAPDAPLTEAGERQAVELTERLSSLGIDHVVSSPYARARATIQPFATRAGLPVNIDERLAERRLSPGPIDHWRDVVRRSFVDPDFRIEGGESGREALARGWAAIESLVEGEFHCPVAVSHGQLLSLVLHSIDPGFGFAGWEALCNPDAHLLERMPGGGYRFARIK